MPVFILIVPINVNLNTAITLLKDINIWIIWSVLMSSTLLRSAYLPWQILLTKSLRFDLTGDYVERALFLLISILVWLQIKPQIYPLQIQEDYALENAK